MTRTILEKIFIMGDDLYNPHIVPILVGEYDFFNKINEKQQSLTQKELEKLFKFDERVFDAVLSFLLLEGYLIKTKNKFSLSSDVKNYLLKENKYNLSNLASVMLGITPLQIKKTIKLALEKGEVNEDGSPFYILLKDQKNNSEMSKMSKNFLNGLMCRVDILGDYLIKNLKNVLTKNKKLLDIGGALGDYCGKFTKEFKNLNCTVFDLKIVVDSAKKNIQTKKYTRVDTLAGDMFKSIPKKYDSHLISNTIHNWDTKRLELLFKNSFNSLDKNGIILIHDLFLDNNKQGSCTAVNHSLLLALVCKGKCYSSNEVILMLKKAGFIKLEFRKSNKLGYGVIIGYKN